MTALALCVGFVLAAAAPAERVVVLPFEPLGIEPERAARVEKAVRASLARVPGVEVADPAALRALLVSDASLRDCAETRCLSALAARLDVHAVVSGVVAGLGSFMSLVVKRTDREGRVVTSVSEAISEEGGGVAALVCAAMGRNAACHDEQPPLAAAPPSVSTAGAGQEGLRATRKAALGVGAGAIAALAVAAGFGLSASAITGQVERKELTCDGSTGAACLDSKLSTGRTHATVSNAFWGVGGALAAAAIVLFVLPESKATVALGPGPAPLGLSAHGRF